MHLPHRIRIMLGMGLPLDFIANVVTALVLGAVLGLERQLRHRNAGLRVTALVCVGAALFVSLSILVEHDSSPTRVAGQVASGIGFLGAGVILREGLNVRGMTTAAALWCSAAVGILAGMGLRWQAAAGAAAVLFVNLGLRPLAKRVDAYNRHYSDVETIYRVRVTCDRDGESGVRLACVDHVHGKLRQHIQSLAVEDGGDHGRMVVKMEVIAAHRTDQGVEELVSQLRKQPGVTAVSWERQTLLA